MIAFQSLVGNHFTGKSDRANHVYDLRLEICRVKFTVCSGWNMLQSFLTGEPLRSLERARM